MGVGIAENLAIGVGFGLAGKGLGKLFNKLATTDLVKFGTDTAENYELYLKNAESSDLKINKWLEEILEKP